MLRVIHEARPAWVVGENVAGIVNMELDTVLSDLEGEGYAVQSLIIPACAVDAKHRRDRVWIIANRKESRREAWSRDGLRTEQGQREGFTSRESGEIVGNATSARCDNEGKYDGGSSLLSARLEQSSEIVAHADRAGLGEQRAEPVQAQHCAAERDSEALAHADVEQIRNGQSAWIGRWNGTQADVEQAGRRGRSESYVEWLPEPDVGRVADGLSAGVDRHCQWPDEPPDVPRVATGVKNRVARLKALGNSVVPQVAYEILRVIAEIESRRSKPELPA
jgi:DNA (cytosine-5)-methyltransferase 1